MKPSFYSVASAYHRITLQAVLFLLLPCYSMAQGNLAIFPKRMVLTTNKRTDQFNLINSGKDTARYQISVKEFKMGEDGSFTEVIAPDSTGNSAGKFIRFFPRSITLAPNDPQMIKVQLINSGKIRPGEYRSHLFFRAVDNLTTDSAAKKSKKVTVQLPITIGITLPVIIDVGEVNVKTDIADLTLVYITAAAAPVLNFTLNRTGNMSAFGSITVTDTSPQGKKTNVGLITNLAIYTPNALRKIKMQLSGENIDWHSGKLHIEFTPAQITKITTVTAAETILK